MKKKQSIKEKTQDKLDRITAEGSLRKKGKVYYFYRRDAKELVCESVEINTLQNTFVFPTTQELFTIDDVSLLEGSLPIWFVYRGFNFSTKIYYDVKEQCFVEAQYSKEYMKRTRLSQWIKRILGLKNQLTYKFFLSLIFCLITWSLIWIMAYLGIIVYNT